MDMKYVAWKIHILQLSNRTVTKRPKNVTIVKTSSSLVLLPKVFVIEFLELHDSVVVKCYEPQRSSALYQMV